MARQRVAERLHRQLPLLGRLLLHQPVATPPSGWLPVATAARVQRAAQAQRQQQQLKGAALAAGQPHEAGPLGVLEPMLVAWLEWQWQRRVVPGACGSCVDGLPQVTGTLLQLAQPRGLPVDAEVQVR